MNDDIKRKSRHHNRFIAPVFSIAFFVILTMSVSYGFFVYSGTSNDNTIYSNTAFPYRCSLETTTNSASIQISKADLVQQSSPTASFSNIISSNVTLNGSTDCNCTYYVKLYQEAGSGTYTPTASGVNEFTYTVSATTTTAENSNSVSGTTERNYNECPIGSLSTGCTVGSGTIAVASDGTLVRHEWTVESKFYYLSNYNQLALQGNTYKYSFRFVINACSFT